MLGAPLQLPAPQQQQQQQQQHGRRYEYHGIIDILAAIPDNKYNLYAVVTECSVARPTRTVDWMCNLRVADPSTTGAGLPDTEILCFARLVEKLPKPACVGSIIRLHRLKLQEFQDRPQLLACIPPGPNKFCAYLLFTSTPAPEGTPDLPYFTSSTGYTLDVNDADLLRLLRTCIATGGVPSLAAGVGGTAGQYLRRIRELDPAHMTSQSAATGEPVRNTFFDLCCKVLHVEGEGGGRVLWVWDGTDALPLPEGADTRHDFAAQANVEAGEHLGALARRILPLQAADLPRLGSAMPVVLYALDARCGAQKLPAAGDWVKLRNVAACVVQGQLQALYRKASKWTPWAPKPDVLALLEARDHEGPVAEWAPEDAAELLATSLHPNMPFETLRQVHQASVCKRGTKHRCLVRVLSHFPGQVDRFCVSRAEAGLPVTGMQAEHVYTFGLTLEDATGQLDAAVFDEDGATFFRGKAARDLQADHSFAGQIEYAMECLLGTRVDRQGSVWMECCLKGYTVAKGQPHEQRMYRIFDTQLRPDLLSMGS